MGVPIITMVIGGVIKVAMNWFLVADPDIGIKAAPLSTLVCYALISLMNLAAVARVVQQKPRYLQLFSKPLLCSIVMGFSAKYGFALLLPRFGNALSVLGAIAAAVVVYGALVLLLRVITREDLVMLPKGEKVADILRLR